MRSSATVSTEESSSKSNGDMSNLSYYSAMEGGGASRDELDGFGKSHIDVANTRYAQIHVERHRQTLHTC